MLLQGMDLSLQPTTALPVYWQPHGTQAGGQRQACHTHAAQLLLLVGEQGEQLLLGCCCWCSCRLGHEPGEAYSWLCYWESMMSTTTTSLHCCLALAHHRQHI
jgi:hypothetical protein